MSCVVSLSVVTSGVLRALCAETELMMRESGFAAGPFREEGCPHADHKRSAGPPSHSRHAVFFALASPPLLFPYPVCLVGRQSRKGATTTRRGKRKGGDTEVMTVALIFHFLWSGGEQQPEAGTGEVLSRGYGRLCAGSTGQTESRAALRIRSHVSQSMPFLWRSGRAERARAERRAHNTRLLRREPARAAAPSGAVTRSVRGPSWGFRGLRPLGERSVPKTASAD